MPEIAASFATNEASGLLRVIRAVRGSGVSTPATNPLNAYAKPRLILMSRSIVTLTASESSGVPSWNVTPGRSFRVHCLTSGVALHEVASLGTILGVPPSRPTSGS